MTILMGFLVGSVIGFMGGIYEWGLTRTIVTTFITTSLIVLLSSALSHADPAQVTKALRSNTVRVQSGTGSTVRGPSGKVYLLTNWHVCQGTLWKGELSGAYPNGFLVKGPVVKVNAKYDLCAARVSSRYSLPIGKTIAPNQPVYTR